MAEQLSALQLALLAQKASEQRRLLAAEPIAVVGTGCRLPGGHGRPDLVTPEQFWQFLLQGGEAVSEVPDSRWTLERYYDATPGTPGKMHCRHGAFLAEPEQFDPARFGISPREAQAIDPQHRLLLEVAAEALERAALPPESLRGTPAGVYLGLCTTDYAWRQLRAQAPDANYDMYFATGTSFSMAPGRLAYALGLQGPALAVDTACSSSLVAVDLAIRSLRDRSTDMALAGGVSLLLTPVNSLCFAGSGMMAADGHCKTFDASADGYVRGEGCGVVVLKRLADALAQGDPVLAVLRGSGVNQDGASAGLTVPNGEAQAGLIRRTLEQAQLTGDEIDVLEAHGTGTPLGDPIELKALAPIYGQPGRVEPLRLGSVKTNLGHLEGAAGIAGLLKSVLMLQHGQIPPHLHFRQPTPYLNWGDWQLTVPTSPQSWPEKQGPRRAAVSSFGFSGTNAHVLLEQAPELSAGAVNASPLLKERELLLLSAGSEAGLQQLALQMADWLVDQPEQAWPAIAATSRLARSAGRWRLAIQASSQEDAIAQLRADWAASEIPAQPKRLAFALSAESTREAKEAWASFGLDASALVVPPGQEGRAQQLAGQPAQLRLIPQSQSEAQLQEHGYGPPVPLAAPKAAALAGLWLAGHRIDWTGLAPQGRWQRQILPVTPFDRVRCWIDEDLTSEADLASLQHQRQWVASDLAPSAGAVSPIWLLGAAPSAWTEVVRVLPDLAAFEAALSSTVERPVLLLAPSGFSHGLDQRDWEASLPLLQGVLVRLRSLQRVHWWIPESGHPAAEAWAALARCLARELGPQAGGLLWGAALTRLLPQLEAIQAGEEWRSTSAGLERSQLALVSVPSAGRAEALLPPNSTTLITGGLGALGLATAEALQRLGARHLTLVSRRAPNEQQQQRIAALEQACASVHVEQLDVSDAVQVEALFDRLKSSGRPLAGIIHAAGSLDDGLLSHQTPERCAAVSAAKVQGALHLDRCSRAIPHNFFVSYSSLAAVVGSPGQVPYGAANGFLDGLMQQRMRDGLPGLSINWGPWAGGGMAAQHQGGLQPLQPADALVLLERWLPQQGQVVLADLQAAAVSNPLVLKLQALAEALTEAAEDQAQGLVEACLAELLADLGGFALAELQSETRLDALGLDSLMAVELASAVQTALGVSLGMGALTGEPTVASLSAHLLALLENPGAAYEQVDLGAEAQLPEDLIEQLGAMTPKVGPAQAVLLTGATGFLGAFLLADQLERHTDLTVYCLVRAEGAGAGRARLRSNLEHYGLWQDAWASRIVALPGDLAQPRLGLDDTTWQGLVERLGGILHNGAQLSYVASYGQLKASNVSGTVAVLRLAAAASVPLEYISSTSVYEAADYRGQALDESSDLSAWQGIHLGYSQTKWVSERLVWSAAQAGLPVRLYRPPLIAGHSTTGAWHEQDFLHRLVRGCLALRHAPSLPMELDLVPVDYVVAAIGALAWSPVQGFDVLHLHHPRPVLWSDFLGGLVERGAPLAPMELDAWLAALAAQPSNPLYPLQPFFTHRWGAEQLTYPELNAPGLRARPSCARSQERLRQLGVECTDFEQLVDPYARTFLADLLVHG